MIECVGGDGTTINTQIVTADVVRRMLLVAALLAAAFVERINHHKKD